MAWRYSKKRYRSDALRCIDGKQKKDRPKEPVVRVEGGKNK